MKNSTGKLMCATLATLALFVTDMGAGDWRKELFEDSMVAATPASPAPRWAPDIESAFTAAKRDDRPVMLVVYALECPSCEKLMKSLRNDGEAMRSLTRKVVPLHMTEPEFYAANGTAFQIESVPTILFFTPDGRLLTRPLSGNPVDIGEFLAYVDRVADGYRRLQERQGTEKGSMDGEDRRP